MRYRALACDYDGTIATDGRVPPEVEDALRRVRSSGRAVLLVTGRELDDLKRVFPRLDLFDRVVAENGALLHCPGTNETQPLADPAPQAFVRLLRERDVAPLSVGEVIVATWTPHETTVLDVIKELGLEWQVIFNKGAVMALPSGVNKATGLARALEELDLSVHNVVGVGDAENDHAFMAACEFSAAVANAVPFLKDRADVTLAGERGDGVRELVEALLRDDLASLDSGVRRHDVLVGRAGEDELSLPPARETVLVAGPSGSGKSTLVTGFAERLIEQGYQCCIIDPEGDYEGFEPAVRLGSSRRAPTVEEVASFFRSPDASAIVTLLGIPLADRPSFFRTLLPRLAEERARTGRPHWIIVDEAHHMLPVLHGDGGASLPADLRATMLVTVHPDRLPAEVLERVDVMLATRDGRSIARTVARARELPAPEIASDTAVMWRAREGDDPVPFEVAPSRFEHHRHLRKYAEGDLGEERSFYFRGPEKKLNLRAQNLMVFVQMAEGVDDETWRYHVERGDVSRWLRLGVKDPALADAAEEIERNDSLDAEESRARLLELINERYTAPA